MSQLFDSLQRGRQTKLAGRPSHTARGDAVLATLGYAPARRSARASVAIRFVAAGLLLGAASAAWKVHLPAAWAVPSATTAVSSPRPVIAAGVQAPPSVPPAAAPPDSRHPVQPEVPHQVDPPGVLGGAIAALTKPIGTPPRSTGPPLNGLSRPALAVMPESPRGALARPSELDLALYYHRAGDFENALQHYRELLRVNELNAQAHNNLGLLYQERNLLDESARELQRALAIEPGNAGTHNNYGVTLLKQGRVDEALAQFEAASRLSPRNADALVNAALARRESNESGLATETLLRALVIEPRNAAAHYNLAQLYDQANEATAAVVHYRKFLECAGAEYASRAAAVRTRIEVLSTHSN